MKIDIRELIFTGRGSTSLWAILKCITQQNSKISKILIPVNICEIIIPIIYKSGLIPVYYDVDEIRGNANLNHIINAYTGNEQILLAVHNFGIPLEIDEISQWAKDNNIFVIEDICNAIGAIYKGTPLGSWGDASIFSFGYAKIIEYGIGGALKIKNKEIGQNVQTVLSELEPYSKMHKNKNSDIQSQLRDLRKNKEMQTPFFYCHLYQEYADYLLYNISDKNIKEIKYLLTKLPANILERKQKADLYRENINSPNVQHIEEINGQIYWRYNLLVDPQVRSLLIDELRRNNLLVSTWYPPIINLFEDKCESQKFSGSFSFGKRIINLFVDSRVNFQDISKTIKIINNF